MHLTVDSQHMVIKYRD